MSFFARNGTAAAVADAEVIPPAPPANTGFMLMFRAFALTLGIDPAQLAGKLGEFEGIIKTTLQKLSAKADSFDTSLAAIRQRQEEQEARSDANLAAISASLADIAEQLKRMQQQPGPQTLGRTGAAVAKRRAN
jgi:hypothetical protein